MSLLDQAAKNLSPYKLMLQETASKNVEDKFIVQPNLLLDILNDEMTTRLIDKKQKNVVFSNCYDPTTGRRNKLFSVYGLKSMINITRRLRHYRRQMSS